MITSINRILNTNILQVQGWRLNVEGCMLKVEQRFDLTCELVITTLLTEQHNIFQCGECDKEFPKVKNQKN